MLAVQAMHGFHESGHNWRKSQRQVREKVLREMVRPREY